MRRDKKDIPIKKILIITFVLAMLISIAVIEYLVFSNWYSSSKRITESIAEDICASIHDQINSFIRIPYHMNEAGHKFIGKGILDLADDELRDKFFVTFLNMHDDSIYSFSYGTSNGEYYGARRNEDNIIEIMRNDAETGGRSWYYSVTEDMTAGELVADAGEFDPRTRAWYLEAKETGAPTFSPGLQAFCDGRPGHFRRMACLRQKR